MRINEQNPQGMDWTSLLTWDSSLGVQGPRTRGPQEVLEVRTVDPSTGEDLRSCYTHFRLTELVDLRAEHSEHH